jgi:hypothetical protein
LIFGVNDSGVLVGNYVADNGAAEGVYELDDKFTAPNDPHPGSTLEGTSRVTLSIQ